MSAQTTNPLQHSAIYTATQQANGYRSTLTTLTVTFSVIFLCWSLAHTFIGAPVVPVGVARITVFLAGLWFIFNAITALINHTILTTYRIGIETLAITAQGIFTAMNQAQAQAQADDTGSPPVSPISYLHEAILRKAQEANPPKDA